MISSKQRRRNLLLLSSISNTLKLRVCFVLCSAEQNSSYPWCLLFTQQVRQPHLLVTVDNNRKGKINDVH